MQRGGDGNRARRSCVHMAKRKCQALQGILREVVLVMKNTNERERAIGNKASLIAVPRTYSEKSAKCLVDRYDFGDRSRIRLAASSCQFQVNAFLGGDLHVQRCR